MAILDLIGSSAKFRALLDQINIVAPTDCAVLVQGETGTGKELVAHAIHNRSSRSRGPLVTVNCAAIPGPLLESELFGHERGAFTGAIAQTKGRFQQADQGTMFLDEVGDLPLELQPKLLRVLQEREFERLGGSQPIRVNTRVVAATNQNLEQLVCDKQFRADLYYRLNVIPISLPPLRERSEDIPHLVHHFVEKFSARLHKRIDVVPEDVMEVLKAHDWPGNIRELQNFIERAILLSPGTVLRPTLTELQRITSQRSSAATLTLAESARNHIIEVLEQTGWMIGGRNGAAERLGLPRTTLIYKMRKLGIEARGPRRTRQVAPMERVAEQRTLSAAANF
jgi:formate hydrogenlyase transcriptional activator